MQILAALLFLTVVVEIAHSSTIRIRSHQHCDCSNQENNSQTAPIDPHVITCETNARDSAAPTCPNLFTTLRWKSRKDGPIPSTTVEILELIQQNFPVNARLSETDEAVIGQAFYDQLPRVPDLILSEVSIPTQLHTLRQMQDAILNTTVLLRKVIRSIDHHHTRPIDQHPIRSGIDSHFYSSLEFFLIHLYCPIAQLIGSISSANGQQQQSQTSTDLDSDLSARFFSSPPDPSYSYTCYTDVHCLHMERAILTRLNEVYDRLTKNLDSTKNRIQESSLC